MSHSVTLDPTEVSVTPGGPAVFVDGTIAGVPGDTQVTETVNVAVGSSVVSVNLGVTVDNPEPQVSIQNPDPSLVVSASTPTQDQTDPTTWTFQITVQA